jgi:predicted DNA-binding transcriptional regulator YafY
MTLYPDAVSHLERLVNLAAALSSAERPLPLREIRRRVPGYAEGESGRRTFERDKVALRDLGFDLHAEPLPGDQDTGYRLRPEDWTIGDLDLQPDEAAALGLAASVARLEGESEDSSSPVQVAARLLGWLPQQGDPTISARLGEVSAVHALVSDAVGRSRPLRFTYRPARGDVEPREVEPYGLVLRHGRWYVIGRDKARDATRVFRLDRVEGDVHAGEPGSFSSPEGFRPDEAVPNEMWESGEPTTTARLVLDADIAWWAVRRLRRHTVIEQRADGSLVVDVELSQMEPFVAFVASLLDRAEILSPPEARQALVRHVRSVLTG